MVVYSYGEVREAVRYLKFDGYKRSGAALRKLCMKLPNVLHKDCDGLFLSANHSKDIRKGDSTNQEIIAERLELTGIKTADTIIRTARLPAKPQRFRKRRKI